MKIDLSTINREQFIIRDCIIGGDDCALIFPAHIGAEWIATNLHLRSLIVVKSTGRIISRGQDKFFNHSEKPHLYPDPSAHNDWRISTKLDGSLIIVSKHRGELIVRTRGTSTIDIYETGTEVRALLQPLLDRAQVDCLGFDDLLHSNSLLFEHCSPSNQIVIAYEKPSLTLLDVIAHDETGYWSAKQVDQLALCLGCARPEVHHFNSLDEITATLQTLKGIEGYVLAYNGNRNRIKLKGLDYLSRHRFKERATLPNILDLWFAAGRPDLDTFCAQLERGFDHECLTLARPFALQIRDAAINVKIDFALLENKMPMLRDMSRRDAALWIQERVEKSRQSAAFTMLSNRPVDDKQWRKLMEAELGL